MISQEFQSVLDDLDKQIELAFGKKKAGSKSLSSKKPNKRVKPGDTVPLGSSTVAASAATAPSGLDPQQQTVTQLISKRKNLVRRFRDILPSSSELAIAGPNVRLYHEEEIKREINEATKAALVTASREDKSYLGNPWMGLPALPLHRSISNPRPPAFQLNNITSSSNNK